MSHVGVRSGLDRRMRHGVVVLDGAMGTQLVARRLLDDGRPPELLNVELPAQVSAIHADYARAGAHVVSTNTFGANPVKLAAHGLADRTGELNEQGLRAARLGVGPEVLVAGSVGPLGALLRPLGPLTWDEAVAAFAVQVEALRGCDLLLLETFTDLHELRAAAFAAVRGAHAPVIACAALDAGGTILTGGDVVSLAVALEDMGVLALGLNCGLTPGELAPHAAALADATRLPILVQPNCGLPRSGDGEEHQVSPEDFVAAFRPIFDAGPAFIGGCCGSGPEHIRALAAAAHACRPRPLPEGTWQGPLRVGGRGRTASIHVGGPLVVIGERINPTGRKRLRQELVRGDLSTVRRDALAQVEAGAAILDVNVGTPGVDEAALLPLAVEEAARAMVPLALDSSDPAALAAALGACPGKALINSATAEPGRLEPVLELAAAFGAAVILLPVDGNGVPPTAKGRVEVMEHILRAAGRARVAPHNVLLDAIAGAVGADPHAARETLATLDLMAATFGLPTVLGVGNVSHGLPRRPLLTAAFLAMARCRGLAAAIVNPLEPEIAATTEALAALTEGRDALRRFSDGFRSSRTETSPSSSSSPPPPTPDLLARTVLDGLPADASRLAGELLAQGLSPLSLLDDTLGPAMKTVGERFSRRETFLPGLLASAEAMEAAGAVLTRALAAARIDRPSAGTVVLATVKGDVHDIGKNIVKVMLVNAGFAVVDLGRDVASTVIVDKAVEAGAGVIALSALMTTTLPRMGEVADEVRRRGLALPLLVGGAVVTAEYAASIGAAFAADAAAAPEAAARLLGRKDAAQD